MTLTLVILGWTLFTLVVLVGLALDLVGLFGNWIILGAVAIMWAVSRADYFSITCLVILLLMAIAGELIEFVSASFGATKFGGSKKSALAVMGGCIIGGIVGTPILPIIGTLIGACLGAFAAAMAYEYLVLQREAAHAAWVGLGAVIGKALGLIAKLLIGLAMLLVAAWFL